MNQQLFNLVGSELKRVINKRNASHLFLDPSRSSGKIAEIDFQVSINKVATYKERGETYVRNLLLRNAEDILNYEKQFPEATIRLCDRVISACSAAERELAPQGLVPRSYWVKILVRDDFQFEYKMG